MKENAVRKMSIQRRRNDNKAEAKKSEETYRFYVPIGREHHGRSGEEDYVTRLGADATRRSGGEHAAACVELLDEVVEVDVGRLDVEDSDVETIDGEQAEVIDVEMRVVEDSRSKWFSWN